MAEKLFLEKAYLAYFGNPADPTGAVAFAAATEAEVEAAFFASPESKALFGETFGPAQKSTKSTYHCSVVPLNRRASIAGPTRSLSVY